MALSPRRLEPLVTIRPPFRRPRWWVIRMRSEGERCRVIWRGGNEATARRWYDRLAAMCREGWIALYYEGRADDGRIRSEARVRLV